MSPLNTSHHAGFEYRREHNISHASEMELQGTRHHQHRHQLADKPVHTYRLWRGLWERDQDKVRGNNRSNPLAKAVRKGLGNEMLSCLGPEDEAE